MHRLRFSAGITLALLLVCVPKPHETRADERSGVRETFRVAGYLPDYRLAEFNADATRTLTDLILFSAEPTLEGEIELERLNAVPWDRLHELKRRQRLRLILCVGGWDRSKHFAVVAASREARTRFVQSALRICRTHQLDGLDIDWEHPQNERDQTDYAWLLAELRDGFRPHALKLSVTQAAWQQLPAEAYTAVNFVQLMSYDHKGRHSTLEQAQADVKSLLDRGIPREKLVLGLPFYGRLLADPDKSSTYAEIAAKHRIGPHVDEVEGLYFNGPNTIRRKTRFALESRLGGVMVWEIGQDARGDASLLSVIRDTIAKP
jgi:GH18 family chitinase